MIIGCVKEIKTHEYCVGVGSGYTDDELHRVVRRFRSDRKGYFL